MNNKKLEYLFELIEEFNNKLEIAYIENNISRKWIPKNEVRIFFGYGETQLNAICKKYNLVTSKIGKNKYFLTSSLLKALQENQLS